jgi:hypothetical protein
MMMVMMARPLSYVLTLDRHVVSLTSFRPFQFASHVVVVIVLHFVCCDIRNECDCVRVCARVGMQVETLKCVNTRLVSSNRFVREATVH